MALCESCGTWFDDGGEDWKTLCLRCWKAKKRRESGSQDAVDYWRTRCHRAEKRIFELELSREAAKPSDAILDGLREHLKTLVFCCHPDRNGGDARATAATQFLLSIRELLL